MSSLTPSNPITALVNLDVNAVALVEEGANTRAHILLTKRKENETMSFDELIKALNQEQAELITEHIAELVATKDSEVAKLKEQVEELSKASEPKEDPPTVDITKNASPELKAYVEKLQETVSGLVAAQEEAMAAERFEKVKALPVEEEDLKEILKSVSPAVFGILEKAAVALEASLKAKGKATPEEPDEDFYEVLSKAARAIMKEDSKLSFEQAFTKACERDVETYQKYAKGVK